MNTTITDEELADIDRLDRKASAGPWEHDACLFRPVIANAARQIHVATVAATNGDRTQETADLICRYRALAPRLAKSLKAERAVSAAWKALAKARGTAMQAFDDEDEACATSAAALRALGIDPDA